MTNYELLFVIDPALEDEKKAEAVEAVKAVVETEGSISNVDEWGMRKLAYPIQKKSDGYYVLVDFSAEGTFPKELDRRLKIADTVIRHIIVNKDEK